MQCPKCKFDNSKVIDSRSFSDGGVYRRRRHKCLTCSHHFSTLEIVLPENHIVLSKVNITIFSEFLSNNKVMLLFKEFQNLIKKI